MSMGNIKTISEQQDLISFVQEIARHKFPDIDGMASLGSVRLKRDLEDLQHAAKELLGKLNEDW